MEHMYLVKWKGYPASQNTWEPKKNLVHAADLVKKADQKRKQAEKEAPEPAVKEKKKKPGRKPQAKA